MQNRDRTNILLILFDCLSEADCQRLTHKLPTISNFRAKNTSFENAYVCSPESGPARASLFTGLDMAVNGVWTNGVALPDAERTFTQQFANCGYHTWLVGRRQLSGVSNWTTEHARPSELEHFEWAHGPLHRSRQNAYLNWLQSQAPETYDTIFPNQPNPDETDIQPAQYAAMAALSDDLCFNTWVGKRTIDLLRQHSKKLPFLGIAGFVVGEKMGGAPAKNLVGENLCERSLSQADAALGTILAALEEQGLSQNTIVVVSSGTGSVSTETSKQPMHENAIKVPLLIRSHPHQIARVKAPVSTMDIAATLFELSNVPTPKRMQGRALLSDESEVLPCGWALSRLRNPNQAWQSALRTEQFKLVMVHGQPDTFTEPSFELYDLAADPDETKNLAPDPVYAEQLEAMIDFMIDARVALEDRTQPRIAKF